MLDLNLRISSNHKQDEDCKVPISMFLQQQSNHSSSSSSSDSFITFDKSDSYLRMVPTTFEPALSFGILKKDEKDVILPLLPLPLPHPRPCVDRGDKSNEWLNLWWKERSKEEKVVKKSRRGPRSRSSNYRGVTFYRRTGRWESHIWDSGKQVYLGGFDTAYAAARAYDRAAIKFRGIQADINFVVDDYNQDIEKMNNLSKEEFVQSLRKESASLARSGSKYKGLTLSKCTQLKNHDQIHQFNNRAWNEETIKCNEKGKRNEDIKLGLHNKGNLHNELELSLGISSSDSNGNAKNLYSKQLLPKMVAASSGFPFISVINSSSFHP